MIRVPSLGADGRWRAMVVIAAAGIAQALALGLAAYATRSLFTALHDDARVPALALAILIAAGSLVALLRLASGVIGEQLGHAYAIALRRALYRHFAGLSSSALASRRAGSVGLRFVGDLAAARSWIGLGITRLVSACCVLPGAAMALYLLDPALARAAALPLGLTLLAMLVAALMVERRHRRLRARRATIAISMMERVSMAAELDLHGRTSKEVRQLDRHGRKLARRAVARTRHISVIRALPEIGSAIAAAALLHAASRHDLPAAEAAAGLAVLGILTLPLRELAGVRDRYAAWRVARGKCEKLFDEPSQRRCVGSGSGPVGLQMTAIRHRGLAIDLSVAAGESVLVSGGAAAGKSTLIAIAAGLEHPASGHRQLLRQDDPVSEARVLLIGERMAILQGSLRRALCLGVSPRPDDDEVRAACRRVGLETLLERLGSLDARVAEEGRNLSSSECIRVLLARALLGRPDLLLVDRPEFTQDGELQAMLSDVMHELSATALLALPGDCDLPVDRRLRLDDGQVHVIDTRNGSAPSDEACVMTSELPPSVNR